MILKGNRNRDDVDGASRSTSFEGMEVQRCTTAKQQLGFAPEIIGERIILHQNPVPLEWWAEPARRPQLSGREIVDTYYLY